MSLSLKNLGLYTDYYELVMAQGYFLFKKNQSSVVFDYFFRTNPFGGSYAVFAGLADLLELIDDYRFGEEDLHFLRDQGFRGNFLEYLRDFRFNGTIYSVSEGEVIFPNEPVVRIEGDLIECQLIESLVLNILNYESLIATKASRIKQATGRHVFADFGLRRAPGLGALQASRAAYIGGASSTSNVLAAKLYGIPPSGTQAHSWIQSFPTEAEAFMSFLEANPVNATLLVDTYDTLHSGVPNAIEAARNFEKKGHRLSGIRLDSGNMAYLSKQARKMLDEAGLEYIKIVASNQLNELSIKQLLEEDHAPIDAFGVGTDLVTGKPDAALDGVYKLAESGGEPTMKFSDNIEKATLPGRKNLVRFLDKASMFAADGISLADESPDPFLLQLPSAVEKITVQGLHCEELLNRVYEKGNPIGLQPDIHSAREYHGNRISQLPVGFRQFAQTLHYPVGISKNLHDLRNQLIQEKQ